MREIKYRAWDRKTKTMFAVHEIHLHRISGEIDWIRGYGYSDKDGVDVYGGGMSRYVNEPRYELIQYTGLNDKRGVEIYDGDIFKDSLGTVAVVEWDEENARFLGFTAERKIVYVGREPAVEVIGNIYETPELLQGVTK
jgi:hypothetical protein